MNANVPVIDRIQRLNNCNADHEILYVVTYIHLYWIKYKYQRYAQYQGLKELPWNYVLHGIFQTIQPSEWCSIISKVNEKMTEEKLPERFPIFMAELHTCVASSGSTERIFSTFGLVWTKVRNRPGSEKFKNL